MSYELSNHELTIRAVIDSFQKMCDFIETSEQNECGKCPVQRSCFYKDKHKGLAELMKDLGIKQEQEE